MVSLTQPGLNFLSNLSTNQWFSFDLSYLLGHWTALSNFSYVKTLVITNPSAYSFETGLSLVFSITQTSFLLITFSFICFYLLSFGIRLIQNYLSGVDTYFTTFSYLTDLEEEVGSLDDSLYYFLVFGLFVLWFFFFTIWGGFFFKSISWVVTVFFFVSLAAILIPLFVLKDLGIAFVNYIRGAGRSSSLLFEVMLDFVAVSVIMIRFAVQNIRFVFIFSAFFELYEYIYDKINIESNLFGANVLSPGFFFSSATGNLYWYELVVHFLANWALYLYYLGHLTLLFVAQLSIYFILSFWLFFFLYTTFSLEAHEKYFFFKKNFSTAL